MALPKAGIQLSAEESAAFVRAVTSSEDALQQLGRAMGSTGKKADLFGDMVTGAMHHLGAAVVNVALDAGRAIGQFVTDSIGAAGDFEAGLNRFEAVAGGTFEAAGKDVGDFSELFLQLGADTQFSAAQAEEAAINLAKGGRDAGQVYAELSDVLTLAAAGELELADAAEITAKQLGVWGDQGVTAAEVADLLAQAANASTVDVDELALGLANVGGIAKTAGLSFEETVQTMALLAPGFSSASDAGTSLKTMLTRLQPQTDKQSAAMAKLGLLTEDGTSKFYDATGSFIGMDETAGLLHDSLTGLSEAEKTAALQAIFGQDAFRAAALIAEQGADGFTAMGDAMEAAGGASEQAAKRQKGFNFAMESLGGSMETLQIHLGSKVLPLLTDFVTMAIIPAVNAIADFVSGMEDTTGVLVAFGDFINDVGLPALAGLIAAMITYAIVQTAQAIPAIMAMVPALATAAAGMATTASLAAAAAAPYVLLAAAVYGVVKSYKDFNDKVKTATEQLLSSRPYWTDSAAAIDKYNESSEEIQEVTQGAADSVKALRDQISGEIESLGMRMSAGLVTEEQYRTEIDAINAQTVELQNSTTELNNQIDAQIRAVASSATATTQIQTMTAAQDDFTQSTSLTVGELEELAKQIEKTYEEGAQSLNDFAVTETDFLNGLEERRAKHEEAVKLIMETGNTEQLAAENQAYFDQELAAAESYSRQQAAQNAHLGQMLIDYVVAQATLGNVSKEKAADLTDAIATEFGIQEDTAASAFLNMAASADEWLASSETSTSGIIADLESQRDEFVETQRAADAYAKEYIVEVTGNFIEAGQDVNDYAEDLRDIPTSVTTTVTINEKRNVTYKEDTETGSVKGGGYAGKRAAGGPVMAGVPYVVGEERPEVFVPEQDGSVYPSIPEYNRSVQQPVSAAQIYAQSAQAAGMQHTEVYNITAQYPYQSPVSLMQDIRMRQMLGGTP